MNLRPYQIEALNKSGEALESGIWRQVIAHATGLGKTPLIAEAPKHLKLNGRKLVLAGREELITQAVSKIKAWNPGAKVGIEKADQYAAADDEWVVGCVPSLGRAGSNRLLRFNPKEFSFVATDEAHHSTSTSYITIYDHFGLMDEFQRRILHLGVTATPKRGDGQGLIQVFDAIVHSYDLVQGIKDGWLCNVIGEEIRIGTSLDGVSLAKGELDQRELSTVVNTPAHNKAVLKYWMERAKGRLTAAYCAGVQHAKDINDMARSLGIRSEAVWGVDPARQEKFDALRAGALDIVFNDSLLVEGFDMWQIACILNLKPMKSLPNFIQMLGRGTRLPEGINNLHEARAAGIKLVKEDFLFIDATYSSSRHNLASISSLFGLPPKMGLKGRTLTQAIEEFQTIAFNFPNADLNEATDLDNLESYARSVDLLATRYPKEVTENSDFQWRFDPSGSYVLKVPGRCSLEISPDMIGYSVSGKVEGTSFGPAETPTLSDAFSLADSMIKRHGKGLIKLLRRKPDPGAKRATPNSISFLKFRFDQLGLPEPDWSRLTQSEAITLMTKTSPQKMKGLIGNDLV